jgi:hypothetical protein
VAAFSAKAMRRVGKLGRRREETPGVTLAMLRKMFNEAGKVAWNTFCNPVNKEKAMRVMRIFVFCAIALMAGFAFAQDVKTDYDHATDFSKYRTFMWIKQPNTQNPLMADRIIEAVNAQLRSRGLMLVTDDADLGVSANAATKEHHTLETFYNDFPGGWGWRRYWGAPTTVVDTYKVGTLIVDVFDTHTKQIKWWGSASDTVSDKPEKNVKKLNKAVEKMFKDFPAKGKLQSN